MRSEHGNKIGYARVSMIEQEPALQHDALTRDGCYTVYTDVASGSRDDRPQLAAALKDLGPGGRARGLEARPAGSVAASLNRPGFSGG